MTASRLLAGLIQPVLALLLLAGAPGGGLRGPDDTLLRGIESAAKAIAVQRERAGSLSEALAEPERLDGNDAPEPVALAGPPEQAPFDRARPIRIGRSRYATAPPSHRCCAAPPTGPPLA